MTNKNLHLAFLGVFIIVLTITYSNHFHNPFHFDDSHTIVSNSFIRDLSNIPLFFKDGSTISSLPQNQSYRPLTCVSYAIDYHLGNGLTDTWYFHVSTFLWYILQCALMYFLFLRLMKNSKAHPWTIYVAMFTVAWYGLNTSAAETINYVCARTDSLSTLGVVAGMFTYLFFPNLRKFYLYLIPVAMGNLVKQSALVFAPLLLCYILLFEKNLSASTIFRSANRKLLWDGIRESLPAFLLCIFFYWLVKTMTPDTFKPGVVSTYNFIITQPFVSFHYFKTFFLPTELSADSDWLPLDSIKDWRFVGGIVFILLMLRIAAFTSNKKEMKPIAYGILWFFIALLPSSSIIAFAEVMNDHRIFFPFIGLALAAGWAVGLFVISRAKIISENTSYKFYLIAGILIVLGGNALGTYERNKVWSSDESLWYDVTIKSPKNGRGLMNYGLSQMGKGQYDIAEKYFLRAMEFIPNYSYLHVNMGVLKNALGKFEEAEKYFQNAMNMASDNPEPYYFYANWLKNQNRGTEAIPLCQKALALSPGHAYSKVLLDELIANPTTGESPLKKAEEFAEKNPTAENYLNLSLTYFRARKFEECIEACNKALKLKPDFATAYNNICSAYNELQQWQKAKEACEKAIQIDPNFQLAKNNLNYSLKQLGGESKK